MKRILLTLCLLSMGVVTSAAAGNIAGGSTTVTFSSTFLSVLSSNNLVPSAIAPGTLAGAAATFPITVGNIDSMGNAIIDHSGGLTLTGGANFLSIGDFEIDTAMAEVSGFAKNNLGLNASSVPLFNIGSGLELYLTSTAAGAVSATFFSSDPAVTQQLTGLDVGTASVSPVVTPEPASLALLGTGISGLVVWSRRKFRG